jgi:hypothetical protein
VFFAIFAAIIPDFPISKALPNLRVLPDKYETVLLCRKHLNYDDKRGQLSVAGFVAQISKSAVSPVSKPASDNLYPRFSTGKVSTKRW